MNCVDTYDMDGKTVYQLYLAWSIQREVIENVAFFLHGYVNTGNKMTTSAIGAGLQWTPSNELTLFSNVNAGLTDSTPEVSTLTGFALAF